MHLLLPPDPLNQHADRDASCGRDIVGRKCEVRFSVKADGFVRGDVASQARNANSTSPLNCADSRSASPVRRWSVAISHAVNSATSAKFCCPAPSDARTDCVRLAAAWAVPGGLYSGPAWRSGRRSTR